MEDSLDESLELAKQAYFELQVECEKLKLELRKEKRKYESEILQLKTSYQAELEKTQSLEASMKKYSNSSIKVKKLKNELAITKKLSEHEGEDQKLSELTLVIERLKNELNLNKKANLEELEEKELTIVKLEKEKEQFKKGFEDEMSEYKEIKEQFEKLYDENDNLSEENSHLSEQVELAKKAVHEIRAKNENTLEELKEEFKFEIEKAVEEQKEKIRRLEDHMEEISEENLRLINKEKELRSSKIEYAAQMDRQEQEIISLKTEKAKLVEDFRAEARKIQSLEATVENTEQYAETLYTSTLSELTEKNDYLERKINEIEKETQEQLEKKEEEISEAKSATKLVIKTVEAKEKEIKSLIEKNEILKEINEDLKQKIAYCEENRTEILQEGRDELQPLIQKLQAERDELRLKEKELQNKLNFTRVSVFEGQTLNSELEDVDEDFKSFFESSRDNSEQVDQLKVEICKQEHTIKVMELEKQHIEEECKELHRENRSLKTELERNVELENTLNKELEKVSMIKYSVEGFLNETMELEENEGNYEEILYERDMLKAEKCHLETEMLLTKEEIAEYNNELREELDREGEEMRELKQNLFVVENELRHLHTKMGNKEPKRSFFKRIFRIGNK